MTPHTQAIYSAVHRIGHGPPTYFGHHRVNQVAEFGLSTASLAHQLGRRGDVRIRKICQWMEAEGVLVSRLANLSPIEIWELKTPEAVKRAEVRFR